MQNAKSKIGAYEKQKTAEKGIAAGVEKGEQKKRKKDRKKRWQEGVSLVR